MGKIPRGQGPVRFCEMRKDEGLWLRVGAAVEIWRLEQRLGGAGDWEVAEGPGLSRIDGERAQAGAGHSGRN